MRWNESFFLMEGAYYACVHVFATSLYGRQMNTDKLLRDLHSERLLGADDEPRPNGDASTESIPVHVTSLPSLSPREMIRLPAFWMIYISMLAYVYMRTWMVYIYIYHVFACLPVYVP